MNDNRHLNNIVKNWVKATLADLDKKFDTLDIQHRPHSKSAVAARESLKAAIRRKLGIPHTISLKFPRHMVFVQKGVGNGVPAALAGTSATKRKPKDWFNSVIDKNVEELGEKVADATGDMIVNNLRIK